MKNKIAELQTFLDKHNTDIAIVIETWLTPTVKIRIRNYNIHRKDESLSTSNKPKGGVLIAIRKDIPPQHISTNIDIIKTQDHTPTHNQRRICPF